jgi:hypothetical protein
MVRHRSSLAPEAKGSRSAKSVTSASKGRRASTEHQAKRAHPESRAMGIILQGRTPNQRETDGVTGSPRESCLGEQEGMERMSWRPLSKVRCGHGCARSLPQGGDLDDSIVEFTEAQASTRHSPAPCR